ncbi:hypothetical protein NUW54_g4347 [Trametes sanguinea]|uniref:Uncharacterized protein n=1 Tax=Trametes sanguinea TaxID=158606 RepID=A0ACC1Q0P6_9APHY|nr:hypothetical protein NUW54_g4347 [Trametes sanguinea]
MVRVSPYRGSLQTSECAPFVRGDPQAGLEDESCHERSQKKEGRTSLQHCCSAIEFDLRSRLPPSSIHTLHWHSFQLSPSLPRPHHAHSLITPTIYSQMDSGMGNDILFASLNALPVNGGLPACQRDPKMDEFLVDPDLSASPFPPTFDPYSFDDVDWSSIFADTTSASTPSFSSITNTSDSPGSPPRSPSSASDSAISSLTSPSAGEWLVHGDGDTIDPPTSFLLNDSGYDFEFAVGGDSLCASGLAVPIDNLKHAQRLEHEYVSMLWRIEMVCVPVAVEVSMSTLDIVCCMIADCAIEQDPCPALSPLSACKRERSLDRRGPCPVLGEKLLYGAGAIGSVVA